MEIFKERRSLCPEFVRALHEISAVYVKIAELETAGDALHRALKIEPNNPTGRLNLWLCADAKRTIRRF
jgi:hypothetical protein